MLFIKFCQHFVNNFSFNSVEKHIYNDLLILSEDKVPNVVIKFLQIAGDVRSVILDTDMDQVNKYES